MESSGLISPWLILCRVALVQSQFLLFAVLYTAVDCTNCTNIHDIVLSKVSKDYKECECDQGRIKPSGGPMPKYVGSLFSG